MQKNDQFIHVRVKIKDCTEWHFTAIYASPQENTRRLLWEELKNLAATITDPWMLAGDFNDLADSSDKKGGAPVSVRRCRNFQNRMNMCKLSELVSHGPKFT